jgi:hypothetical protein
VTDCRWLPYALRYAALGWATFPLHWMVSGKCSCGDGDCRSPAKHPLTAAGVHDATTDPVTLQAWAQRWPQANLGLALRDHLVVIDTDPRNGGDITLDELQTKHGPLPDTALQMTGGGGTHHVYRNATGLKPPGKLGKGVDVKGEGGYIVVEPSIHASGTAYAWEASSDPTDGAAIAPLPDWVVSGPKGPALQLVSSGMIHAQQAIEIRSALGYINADDRDTWIRMGMALHSTGAANAYGLWTEWSQQSDKFDPVDQRRTWNSFKPSTIHVESIFTEAAAAGWVNPASKVAQQFDEATEKAIEEANSRTRVEVVDVPEPVTDPIPVPILEAAGDWINSRYPITHPDVTRQTVLALAALGASRIYLGEGGSPAHLCLGIVAQSSVLTDYARDAIAKIIDESGLRRMMRGTRANSPSSVYSTLWRSPAAIHVIGDYGHLAQFAKRQPSGVLDQVFSVMADAYTANSIYIDSPSEIGLKSATDEQMVVHSPALTTLLLSTHDQMSALLQRGEISRGLLAHQLPVIVDTAGAVQREPIADTTPPWLRDMMRTVRRLPADPGDLSPAQIFGQQPGSKPHFIKVRFATDFTEYQSAINAVSDAERHQPLVLAAQRTARRIATALGAWADPSGPIASREVLAWSTSYVIRHLRAWLERFDTLGSEDGKADVGQQIVQLVTERKAKGIPRSELHMYCRAFRNIRDKEKRTKLIDGLIEDGDLIEYTRPGERRKTLVAQKFAHVTQMRIIK